MMHQAEKDTKLSTKKESLRRSEIKEGTWTLRTDSPEVQYSLLNHCTSIEMTLPHAIVLKGLNLHIHIGYEEKGMPPKTEERC